MIYFVIGSSIREIELEKLKENFENVLKFDANIKEEYEKFIDNIYLNSLFSTNELLILKNSHKLKKDRRAYR